MSRSKRSTSGARASTASVTRPGITLPEPGGLDEGVVARLHGNGARVAGTTLCDELAPGDAGDRRHDAERRAPVGQPGALLDVQLDVGARSLGERAASGTAALLVAKGDDDAATRALDRLDPGDDAEGPVVAAPVRHRVEMRA